MKHLLWFFILVGMLCCVSQPAKAQNPNPCSQVTNTATAGQVLSAVNGGNTPPCQWVTGGGGGSVSLTGGTGISVSPNPITGTGVITNTAPGALPAGVQHELQTNGGSNTFAGSNWFISAFGDLLNGSPDYSVAFPYFIPATNSLGLFPSQFSNSELEMSIRVPPGGHGSDTSEFDASALATADSATGYTDSQINIGVVSADGSTSHNVYAFGSETTCTTPNNCATFSSYNLFLANAITGETLLENVSSTPHQLDVPAVTQFATLGTYVAAKQIVSNDTADANPLLLSKNAIADTAPGAGYVSFKAVAGTTAGTCKIVMKAGTSATPITLIDNIGSGC